MSRAILIWTTNSKKFRNEVKFGFIYTINLIYLYIHEFIEDLVNLESKEKAIITEKTKKEFKFIQNSTEIEVNTEKRALRESEMKLTKTIDEKFYSLRLDLAKEKKLRESLAIEFFDDVEDKIAEVKNEIDYLNKTRNENHESLLKRLSHEINSFHQLLAEERKKRKDMHNQLLKMISDIQRKISTEIEHERSEREDTQESLIKLLEDT